MGLSPIVLALLAAAAILLRPKQHVSLLDMCENRTRTFESLEQQCRDRELLVKNECETKLGLSHDSFHQCQKDGHAAAAALESKYQGELQVCREEVSGIASNNIEIDSPETLHMSYRAESDGLMKTIELEACQALQNVTLQERSSLEDRLQSIEETHQHALDQCRQVSAQASASCVASCASDLRQKATELQHVEEIFFMKIVVVIIAATALYGAQCVYTAMAINNLDDRGISHYLLMICDSVAQVATSIPKLVLGCLGFAEGVASIDRVLERVFAENRRRQGREVPSPALAAIVDGSSPGMGLASVAQKRGGREECVIDIDWNWIKVLLNEVEEKKTSHLNLRESLQGMLGIITEQISQHHIAEKIPDLDEFVRLCNDAQEEPFARAYTSDIQCPDGVIGLPVFKAASYEFHSPRRFVQVESDEASEGASDEANNGVSQGIKDALPFYIGLHREIFSAMCQSDDGLTVYRGVNFQYPDFLKQFRLKRLLLFYEPKSASRSREVAENFAGENGTVFIIKLKKWFIIKNSFFGNEAEVLIPMFSSFMVTRREAPTGRRHVVEMDEQGNEFGRQCAELAGTLTRVGERTASIFSRET